MSLFHGIFLIFPLHIFLLKYIGIFCEKYSFVVKRNRSSITNQLFLKMLILKLVILQKK